MSKTNVKTIKPAIFTHEGGRAARTSVQNQLMRSVMSCLLWEDSFYEAGDSIATRIGTLVKQNDPAFVANVAIVAREDMKLRHVPLLLVREMVRHESHRPYVAATLERVIQRADELSEALAIYWKDQKDAPIAASFKKGLARAFNKFDRFAISRYDRESDIKLRDVLFLTHAKPKDAEQAALWKDLVDDKLTAPDTWEVALSAGADKRETFTRLIAENKLGALALLRNLRKMTEEKVDADVIKGALAAMKTERVLPFRFIAAARYAPQFEPALEDAMYRCVQGAERLKGKTILLIDVSGSMDAQLSGKSDLTRLDAACGLAILLREICDDVRVLTFSSRTVEVPARRGFALRDAIKNSQPHSATHMQDAINHVQSGAGVDRLIVISDEQTAQAIGGPKTKGYMLNVSSEKNGVGYGAWTHVDGFSESIVRYIAALEQTPQD